jgi:hypothetical protein
MKRTALLGFASWLAVTAPMAALAYNPDDAITYAGNFWNQRNPTYNAYAPNAFPFQTGDCANFVSQCLIAGRINFTGAAGVDDKGAIPLVQNLFLNLIQVRHHKKFAQTDYRSNPHAPTWVVPGDVIMWGDTAKPFRHSGIVVNGSGDSSAVEAVEKLPPSENSHFLVEEFFAKMRPNFAKEASQWRATSEQTTPKVSSFRFPSSSRSCPALSSTL